ncbi:DUF4035 domain-containing protein [Actinobacillus equuli subsp. equuli]|uniref:DUF4035 domain-containing protein n=2 Tax=Actinobacillus equuli TaxID=718 RepID=A0A9X4JF09_ACTEU|nr:DUF4035 domain-containing protein [Actinobacillus equuli]MDE8035743.1 DUF4035 domain-containing protein [Actinobacillus equuli subsp. equuli]
MPERHLQEYELFYQEQPFGLWREDYRTAQISHLLAMINRDTKEKAPEITQFMPFFSKKESIENDDDSWIDDFLAKR